MVGPKFPLFCPIRARSLLIVSTYHDVTVSLATHVQRILTVLWDFNSVDGLLEERSIIVHIFHVDRDVTDGILRRIQSLIRKNLKEGKNRIESFKRNGCVRMCDIKTVTLQESGERLNRWPWDDVGYLHRAKLTLQIRDSS